MSESKRKKVIYISGAVGMILFMIGDWLLDAAGAGDEEVGLIVHSNWPQMAMWRFVMSATLALVALLPVYFASADAIKTARNNEALKAIPIQFFKNFTVAFESLGWLLMYVALALMTAKMEVEKKNEVILIDEE